MERFAAVADDPVTHRFWSPREAQANPPESLVIRPGLSAPTRCWRELRRRVPQQLPLTGTAKGLNLVHVCVKSGNAGHKYLLSQALWLWQRLFGLLVSNFLNDSREFPTPLVV